MNGSQFETMAKSLSRGRSRRAALAALAALGVRVAEVMAKRNRNPDRRPKHRKSSSVQTAAITVGGVPVTVELADQPAELSRGLGYRAGLAPGTGMLFRYPDPAPRSFWMKGMQFCLDIIWIEDGAIQGAAKNVCPAPPGTADADLPSYVSPVPVSSVLEVPAGWLDAHGFGVGTPIAGVPRRR